MRPIHAPLLVTAAAVVALGAALVSQFAFGLAPCVLCHWQRWPYIAAIVLGLAGVALAGRPPALRAMLALAGLAFLTTAGIGAFHVGVEQGWWQGTSECGATVSTVGLSVEDALKRLQEAPVVRCDEVQFELFGISMAGFNVIYAVVAGALALWAAAVMPWRRSAA